MGFSNMKWIEKPAYHGTLRHPKISWRDKLQLSPVVFSLGARKFMSGVHFPSNKNHWPRYLHFVNPPSGLESVEPLNYPWFLSGLSHIFPGFFSINPISPFLLPKRQTPQARLLQRLISKMSC
jgi:hypothetical protein